MNHKKIVPLLIFGVAVLSGCASEQNLVKIDTARTIPDTAPFDDEDDIPYEFQDRSGLEVGYSVQYIELERFSGYKLTFVIRNKSDSVVGFTPRVRMADANGLILQESSYDSLMAEAAALSGTRIPDIPLAQPYGSYQSGTIRNVATGSTYVYSGYSQSQGGFASGYAQGAAIGDAIHAGKQRRYGRMMLEWLPKNWMRNSYTLDPGFAISGSLLYSASEEAELPLKIKLDVGREEFLFETVSET